MQKKLFEKLGMGDPTTRVNQFIHNENYSDDTII